MLFFCWKIYVLSLVFQGRGHPYWRLLIAGSPCMSKPGHDGTTQKSAAFYYASSFLSFVIFIYDSSRCGNCTVCAALVFARWVSSRNSKGFPLNGVRPSVRPSVCPSVTRVIHAKTVVVRIVQFSPYSSPIPLVFARWVSFRNSKGFPLNGGVKQPNFMQIYS